jgi:sugar O-acyltransferase (sialic acid O-acetyltransferase NeuD family)
MKMILIGAKNPETIRVINAVKRSTPNIEILGFLDNDIDKKGKYFYGMPILGGFELLDDYVGKDIYFLNLITGSTTIRYETSKALADKGLKFENLIHPSVDLTMTKIGVGNYIQENVIIQGECQIGNNSAINAGSIIAHETIIGNSVFVAPGVTICGIVKVGDGTLIGANATVLPRRTIGKWCTIGSGAVITKDISDYAVVIGNPGRIIRYNEQLYDSGDILVK